MLTIKPQNIPYLTRHTNGYQVRLPKRVGGKSKFFSFAPDDPNILKDKVLLAALKWRNDAFEGLGHHVFARVVNDLNAGVFKMVYRGQGTMILGTYMVAVWMSEEVQVKRIFSFSVYGPYISGVLAHIARDLGVLLEADRLEEAMAKPNKRKSKK